MIILYHRLSPQKRCPSDESALTALHFKFMCISLVYSGRLIRDPLKHTPVSAINAARGGAKQLWPQFHCQAAGLVNIKQQDGLLT